ncbi:MAG: hypothetical protein ABI478_10860 [Propionivibrio sp.]
MKVGAVRAAEPLEVRYPEFGRLVNDKLTKGGLSNAKYAKVLGVSPEMVRRYRGGYAMAEGKKLDRLSKLTGIDIESLMMADRRKIAARIGEPKPRRPSPDELAMLDEYQQLQEAARKMARARIIELLEEFGPASKTNPYGKGTQ